MRTLLASTVVVLCASGMILAEDKKFDSKDGKFSAKFPGDPKTQATKAGGIDLNIAIVEKGKAGFAVIYSDMPADVVKATAAGKLLEGGEKGLIENFKAKLSKPSTEAKFKSGTNEYPVREIFAEKEPDLFLRVKLILVNNRLYQVFVVGPKDLVNGKEASDFIDSFELGK